MKRAHPAGIFLLPVNSLGILTKGALHGHVVTHHHILHSSAHRLDGNESAAQHIGAARSYADTGHTGRRRLGKCGVHGLHTVDAPQLGTDDIIQLIVIHPLITDSITVQPDVSVSLHETWIHMKPLCLYDLHAFFCLQMFADRFDPAIFHQNISPIGFLVNGVVDISVFYTQHSLTLLIC